MPRLVERDELKAAAAVEFSVHNTGSIAGPAVGGLLIAAVGLEATYALDVATFALSLVALMMMRTPPPPPDAEPPSLKTIVAGVRYAGSRQELIGTYLVDMNAMFFGMPMALFPAIAKRYGGPEILGLLYAAPAVGAIAVTLTSGWTARVHRHGRAIVVFGFADALWLALGCLAVAGGMDAVSGIFRSTIWNETIPDHLRGRLAGVEMISWSSGPLLGNAEAGALAALAVALPRFWSYDSRTRVEGLPPRVTNITDART